MNTNRCTPRYIIIKMAKVKDKERILKEDKKKSHIQGINIRLSPDFSAKTLQDKREWRDAIKC